MKSFAGAVILLAMAGSAFAIAPPVDSPIPPAIVPTGGRGNPDPHGPPNAPVLSAPEPASLTIAGIGLATVGAYRLLRGRRGTR